MIRRFFSRDPYARLSVPEFDPAEAETVERELPDDVNQRTRELAEAKQLLNAHRTRMHLALTDAVKNLDAIRVFAGDDHRRLDV